MNECNLGLTSGWRCQIWALGQGYWLLCLRAPIGAWTLTVAVCPVTWSCSTVHWLQSRDNRYPILHLGIHWSKVRWLWYTILVFLLAKFITSTPPPSQPRLPNQPAHRIKKHIKMCNASMQPGTENSSCSHKPKKGLCEQSERSGLSWVHLLSHR